MTSASDWMLADGVDLLGDLHPGRERRPRPGRSSGGGGLAHGLLLGLEVLVGPVAR